MYGLYFSFQIDGTLNLPTNVLIATVRKYRDQLSVRFERIKSGACDAIVAPQPTGAHLKPSGSGLRAAKPRRRPTKILPLKPYRERINFQKVIVSVQIRDKRIQ